MIEGAEKFLEENRKLAAEALEAAREDLVYKAGKFTVSGTNIGFALGEIRFAFSFIFFGWRFDGCAQFCKLCFVTLEGFGFFTNTLNTYFVYLVSLSNGINYVLSLDNMSEYGVFSV